MKTTIYNLIHQKFPLKAVLGRLFLNFSVKKTELETCEIVQYANHTVLPTSQRYHDSRYKQFET